MSKEILRKKIHKIADAAVYVNRKQLVNGDTNHGGTLSDLHHLILNLYEPVIFPGPHLS